MPISHDPTELLDVAGVGFGPSNVALAVYAREVAAPVQCRFFEQADQTRWHAGMQLPGTRMQISFFKDLVTLRNPASPYSFLQYLASCGRLEHFVNAGQLRPTRREYQDYLRWVTADFTDVVRYHAAVRRVSPVDGSDGPLSLLRLQVEDTRTGERSDVFARNVVFAGGGRPRVPAAGVTLQPPQVIHTSQFDPQFPAAFPDHAQPYTFTVVGGGQSGGEVADYLLGHYPHATVHLVITGYALRPTDNSPFVNEQFYAAEVDEFYARDGAGRGALLAELSNANYGTVRADLIDRLYDNAYHEAVAGQARLVVHRCSRLTAVTPHDDAHPGAPRHTVTVVDRDSGAQEDFASDGVVLATGFDRSLQADVFGELLPLIARDADGEPEVTRGYRVRTTAGRAGIYVQGFAESRFGLGDTLLSLLPFRSKELIDDVCRTVATRPYPPPVYVESDREKLYELIEQYRFATLIGATCSDRPMATHLPMVLDTKRGQLGTLFGHVDRANPQARLLDGRRVLVVFHGPNGYMPPSVYDNAPLPTWNSMAVHVRGRARVLDDHTRLVAGLCEIAQRSGAAGMLTPDDPRIAQLIDQIVGFEIEIEEIVGRFKLSQEHTEANRRRAAHALASSSADDEREFIRRVMGL